MPRVTIGLPCYNQPELLKACLESIKNQTYQDWQCIVLDDGSEPPLEPVVAAFNDARITVHRFPKNRGIPFGSNYLFQNWKTEFSAVLGCDEFIAPSKLEDQVKYMDENPTIDLIWGVPGNGPMGPVPSWEQYARQAHNRSKELWLKCFLNLENVPVGGASALWRSSLFESVGYFDENLIKFSDHEWFCSIIEKHNVRILPYRWMNETQKEILSSIRAGAGMGTRTITTNEELEYVRKKHPLLIPPSEGMITVAIPVYKHARFIAEALKSILAQTDQNFEILIWDDGSPDDVKTAVSGFVWNDPRIQYFRSEVNEGHMQSVNHLLDRAKGEFFISCSADDTVEPNLYEKLRAEFKRDPFLEHVASLNDFITEDGLPHTEPHPFKTIDRARNMTQDQWMARLRQGNVYFGMGMYRTSTLREVGGWDPSHGVISDYEMYLKLLPRYNFRIIEENLTHTRIHGQNQSLLGPAEGKKLRKRYYDAQKKYYQPRPRIIIATPFYELKGFSPYISSLTATTRLLTAHGIEWDFMELSGDSYVHRARNSMCMNFLSDPYNTDLFFIDSDMAWDPQAFINMVFRPEPIIGGTYPVKNKWDSWTSRPEPFGDDKDQHYMGMKLPDGSSLIQATQLAGGFLRIKRSVLEKFIEFYPTHRYGDTHPNPEMHQEQVEFFTAGVDREPEIKLLREIEVLMESQNGSGVDLKTLKPRFDGLKGIRQFIGEDYTFSNRLRAMGIQLFIYPNATISHFGIQGWTGNFDEHLKKMALNPGERATA
jgi:glycosyltransferase involved in cell wall biosynthesis